MSKAILGETKPAERLSRARQRNKLIDACITALHQFGPSRTTIDKVVTIADMSPGIVNFYFETKAALLVAALEHLAVEFETLVLEPLAALRHTPMAALDRLIELYLDPNVASARKVSVWYSFWGESSSRREYYTICGKRDLAFAVMVQDLMARAIQQTRLMHLDADAMALGLIGCLEMMWQEIAFQDEADVDRETAKKRCRAYLRSVFAGHFGVDARVSGPVDAHAAELSMFRRSWQFACSLEDIPLEGDYVAWKSEVDRVLVLRGAGGVISAFVNTCLHRPHLLVAGDAGRLESSFVCHADGAVYGLDGVRRSGGVLQPLHVAVLDSMIFVTHEAENAGDAPRDVAGAAAQPGAWHHFDVAADWKLVVEHWADAYLDTDARGPREGAATGLRDADRASFSQAWVFGGDSETVVERRLIWPNLFVETRPDGVTIRQVLPLAAGRSRVRVCCCGTAAHAERLWERQDVSAIESTQAGASGEGGAALRAFEIWYDKNVLF
jgi:AcrR family transcriptional regulator/nitrite reductase/ring-hydroxylating ferredoxin subunit